MKRSRLVFLIIVLLFLVNTSPIQSQGTFICVCTSDNFQSGQLCTSWTIVDNCSTFYQPDVNQCSHPTHGCPANPPCEVNCIPSDTTVPPPSFQEIDTSVCDQISTENSRHDTCLTCIQAGGFWTAVGCISVYHPQITIYNLITFSVSIAGGIAILLIIYGAFLISTSAGNIERVQQGKEVLTSAVSGLVFIVLSVAIMQFIGVSIIKIPGL